MTREPLHLTATRLPGARTGPSRRGRRALLATVAALAVLLGAGFGVLGGEDPAPVPTAGAAVTGPAPGPTTGPVPAPPTAPSPSPSVPGPTTPSAPPADPATQPPGPVVAPTGSALAALAELQVQGRAPKTGYDRDQYGNGWVDTDRNGCDTRNDVLARDLTAEQFRPGTNDCVVTSGVLLDPYSGATILFQRGQGTSELVQIDHVVALSNSWQTGAQGWDAERREQFANDPLNLLAVDGALNNQKRDGDTATWLPPDRGYRCAYVARQVAVKVSYGLWTTQAEHDAMTTVLATCPDQPLPSAVG
ncbi:Protein of unknown function [Klenkia marina]|uniref:GmrSD restriction endonucleases C-terminal domain-containing protein n=1 Tax=Klenkia marina TaxID=1960309 RepID=A0A1G4YSN3_9ACTN|nr:HNH endonuclease family protein [Klenkia marina]SCX56355.1 Protein of unknown function [Klenkia marina]